MPRSVEPALPAGSAGAAWADRSCSVMAWSAAGATWPSEPAELPPPPLSRFALHPATITIATSATPTTARRRRMLTLQCWCLVVVTPPGPERFLAPLDPGVVDDRLPGRAAIWKPPPGLHRSPRSPASGRRHLPTPTREPRHPVPAGGRARPVRRLGRRRAHLPGGVVTRAGAGVRQHHPGGGDDRDRVHGRPRLRQPGRRPAGRHQPPAAAPVRPGRAGRRRHGGPAAVRLQRAGRGVPGRVAQPGRAAGPARRRPVRPRAGGGGTGDVPHGDDPAAAHPLPGPQP